MSRLSVFFEQLRKLYYILSILVCLGSISTSSAQVVPSIKEKKLTMTSCLIELDSLTIAPNSVVIRQGASLVTEGFMIQNRQISLNDSLCNRLSDKLITISYRTLPFDIERQYFHLDSTMMKEKDRAIYIGSDYSYTPKGQEIIDAKGLDYNGSFSRGFSVGNSQSLVLNSNFNLQLAGDLGNRIKVVAAISDDNIPIQPEGNTQQIQEFDRVFIKVSRDKTSIIAGDYNLTRPKSYFINYFKKLQGLSGQNLFSLGKDKSLETNASFAISRGKFARQTLDTKEGNQGPYKLTGNGGERFLIVLSGSEKVYLDGRLLERGLDYDYVIDYNRAEVTFTPNRIIGRESRIIVEYEYRDQNYLRSVYAANAYYTTPKFDLSFNFYNEQDSKTATGDIVIDSLDIRRLQQAGDDLDAARVASRRLAPDSISRPGEIRYRLNPATMMGDQDSVFLEYSTDQSENLYVASFLEVGPQGRYIIDESTNVNGRVYRYVGPGNGTYDPVTSLIPPEKKQAISLGATIRPNDKINIATELSISNTDINRFASLGNEDNLGTAGMITYSHMLYKNTKRKTILATDVKYEFVDIDYATLNPYRTAEFNRDWNINGTKIDGRQNLLHSSLIYSKSDTLNLVYNFKLLGIDGTDQYRGANHNGELAYKIGGLTIDSKYDVLSSEGYGEQTLFQRPKATVSQLLSKKHSLSIGGGYEAETNKRTDLLTGELLKSSFAFDIYKAFIENAPGGRLHYKLQYNARNDFFPEIEQLQKSIKTNELNSSASWTISPKHALSFNFGIRDFKVIDAYKDLLPPSTNSKKTLIGRLDHNLTTLGGGLASTTNYLINSGQEPKIEFFYEKVEEGQGDYIYIGNADSTLVNTNFRYAPNLGTGEYIRLSLINNEFITTNNQSLTQSIRLDPKKFFLSRKNKKRKKTAVQDSTQSLIKKDIKSEKKKKKKKKKPGLTERVLSKLATVSTFRISKKVEDDGTNDRQSFLNFSSDDIDLVSYQSLISNTLFVNRGNPLFDFQVGHKVTENVFTQISGREERMQDEIFFRSRIKVWQKMDFILNAKNGIKGYKSEIDPSRNLDIDFYSINPELSYRPSSDLRFNLLYTFLNRDQQIHLKEQATSHDFTLSTTYRQASSANLNLSLSYVDVDYTGLPNSTAEFDLLEGLKDGRNFLWNVLFTKRLSNSVDLNISYEGRSTGDAPTIHIARAQVKATF